MSRTHPKHNDYFKLLAVTAAITFSSISNLVAQTLKITAIDASTPKLYKSTAEQCLGKDMVLSVYDNSAKARVSDLETVILKQTSENHYSTIRRETDNETETYYLEVNKTLNIVTSAKIKVVISEKSGQKRVAWPYITAKRF